MGEYNVKRIMVLITALFILVLMGCSNSESDKVSEPKIIPMAENIEGTYNGYTSGNLIEIGTDKGIVKLELSNEAKNMIKELKLEQGRKVKVLCTVYDEGNGKKRRIVKTIELTN